MNSPEHGGVGVDVQMSSPPRVGVNSLQGASRVSGGIVRGQALGNKLNHADLELLNQPALPNTKGTVNVYTSITSVRGDPIAMKPSMTIQIPVNSTLGPILSKLGSLYSPVEHENQRIYTYTKQETWDVKGRYNAALKEDDMIDWKFTEYGYVLHLFVSCNCQ